MTLTNFLRIFFLFVVFWLVVMGFTGVLSWLEVGTIIIGIIVAMALAAWVERGHPEW